MSCPGIVLIVLPWYSIDSIAKNIIYFKARTIFEKIIRFSNLILLPQTHSPVPQVPDPGIIEQFINNLEVNLSI